MEKHNNTWKTVIMVLLYEIPSLAFLTASIYSFMNGHPVVGSFCLGFSLITFPQIKI